MTDDRADEATGPQEHSDSASELAADIAWSTALEGRALSPESITRLTDAIRRDQQDQPGSPDAGEGTTAD